MSLPQREGREKLSILPDEDTQLCSDFSDPIGAKYCQEDYGDTGANDCNKPVPSGKVQGPYHNGWSRAGSEEYPENPAAKKDKL